MELLLHSLSGGGGGGSNSTSLLPLLTLFLSSSLQGVSHHFFFHLRSALIELLQHALFSSLSSNDLFLTVRGRFLSDWVCPPWHRRLPSENPDHPEPFNLMYSLYFDDIAFRAAEI